MPKPRRHPEAHWRFAMLATLAAVHCGDDATAPTDTSIQTEALSIVDASWRDTASIPSTAPADAVGIDTEGRLWTTIDGGAFVIEAGALNPRLPFADAGAPTQLGRVQRIRPRVDGGAWLATDEGLWSAAGLYVRHRPTDLPNPRLLDVQEVSTGALAGLWLAASDGVYWTTTTSAQRIEADRPADRLAVNGTVAALVDATGLRLLTSSADGLLLEDAPFNTPVRDVAATADAIYVATDDGLYRYRDAVWTEFTLDDVPLGRIDALAVRGDDVWGRSSDAILAIGPMARRFPVIGTSGLAVDQLGDVYAASATGLARASSGAVADVTTFSQDILPWIDTHCAVCHGNQTQDFRTYDVFRSVASDALTRVRSGDMPRCEGGVRCAPEDNLSADDYSVLERWIRAGLPE